MDKIQCHRCGHETDAGARFCVKCGASNEPHVRCGACHHAQPVSNAFCLQCGIELAGAEWAKAPPIAGGIVEGTWQRAPEEFVRRVDPEEAKSFLGNKVLRVPPGSVGVVVVDGVVDRVLPPGQQTAISLFHRITNFFSGRVDRTALYLVNLRPLPIPFTVQTRLTAGGRAIGTQVLVSCYVERNDKDRLGQFLANVVGARTSYGAIDLFQDLRPEVTELAGGVLERLAAGGQVRAADAEAEIRAALRDRIEGRWSLAVLVTVAPLAATTTLDLHLGVARGSATRACAACRAEIPATMKFCDRCGEPQKALSSDPERADLPLLTADGRAIELDVVARVRGQDDALDRAALTRSLTSAAAALARGVPLAVIATGATFDALEAALRTKASELVTAQGLELVSIVVVDVRSASGEWLLGARADLNRAKDEATIGRAWLTQRADETDLLGLTLAQALAQQRTTRAAKLSEIELDLAAKTREATLVADDAFVREGAHLADQTRRQEIAEGRAKLDVLDAKRISWRDREVETAAREASRAKRGGERDDELDEMRHAIDKEDKALAVVAARVRQETALTAEAARARADVVFEDHARRARLEEDLAAGEEERQIKKLAAMAELDAKISAQEHAQEKELRAMLTELDPQKMIAVQAAALAKSEGGGAAWAAALAGHVELAAAEKRLAATERHAGEMRDVLEKQADRMRELTQRVLEGGIGAQRDAASAAVFGQSLDAVARVAASRAEAAPVVAAVAVPFATTTPCAACGAPLRADASFCGACGKSRAGKEGGES